MFSFSFTQYFLIRKQCIKQIHIIIYIKKCFFLCINKKILYNTIHIKRKSMTTTSTNKIVINMQTMLHADWRVHFLSITTRCHHWFLPWQCTAIYFSSLADLVKDHLEVNIDEMWSSMVRRGTHREEVCTHSLDVNTHLHTCRIAVSPIRLTGSKHALKMHPVCVGCSSCQLDINPVYHLGCAWTV